MCQKLKAPLEEHRWIMKTMHEFLRHFAEKDRSFFKSRAVRFKRKNKKEKGEKQ